MKSILLNSCAALAVTVFAFVSPANANPLSFTVNLDANNDFAITNEPMRKEGSILDVLRDDKRFRRVVKALEDNRGLRDDLERKDKITFLAPTDEAWENMEMVLDAIRDNRKRRRSVDENDRKGRDDRDRRDMEEVLRYHILKDEISMKDLFNGQLLQTELKESELEDKRQRIRVVDFFGQYYMNMYARVHHEELNAKNGMILIIDNVLCPPLEASEMMGSMPFAYSTMLVAAEKTDLLKTMQEEKGVTVFAPVNYAWKHLGMQNLIYLFSPHGRKDLKRIMQYHIARDVVYTTDMMKENKMRIRTLLHDQEIEIRACEREGGRHGRPGRGHDRNRDSERDDDRDSKKKRDEECPFNYVFTINKGEARIENTCADFLAENGVIHAISSVMMPPDMTLPYAMSNMGAEM
jgi:uncharacterized surface protein with fasciclin (FAS1) repeats